jgi:hypothetical protein
MMSPRFGARRMEQAHGTFEAIPARSAAGFFALCRTTRTIGRRSFKTEEFFAGWHNWIAALADHLGSGEECAGGCGGANKIKDDNLKLEEQIRGRLKARRTTQHAVPRSSNHDDSAGRAVQCPAFRVGRPPFDQAQGGPTATRGGTAPAAGEECWPLFCTGVRMLENLSRSARKRKKAQRCEVRNWASKAQRKSNIIQWIGYRPCMSRRFDGGNRDRAYQRWPSRRSKDQNVTNEPKGIRWLEMHKMRLEL